MKYIFRNTTSFCTYFLELSACLPGSVSVLNNISKARDIIGISIRSTGRYLSWRLDIYLSESIFLYSLSVVDSVSSSVSFGTEKHFKKQQISLLLLSEDPVAIYLERMKYIFRKTTSLFTYFPELTACLPGSVLVLKNTSKARDII